MPSGSQRVCRVLELSRRIVLFFDKTHYHTPRGLRREQTDPAPAADQSSAGPAATSARKAAKAVSYPTGSAFHDSAWPAPSVRT